MPDRWHCMRCGARYDAESCPRCGLRPGSDLPTTMARRPWADTQLITDPLAGANHQEGTRPDVQEPVEEDSPFLLGTVLSRPLPKGHRRPSSRSLALFVVSLLVVTVTLTAALRACAGSGAVAPSVMTDPQAVVAEPTHTAGWTASVMGSGSSPSLTPVSSPPTQALTARPTPTRTPSTASTTRPAPTRTGPRSVATSAATGLSLVAIEPSTGPITNVSELCVDVLNNADTEGNPIQAWECNGTPAQIWRFAVDGTLVAKGMCMTASGSLVVLATCTGSAMQSWQYDTAGELFNHGANLCLTNPGSVSVTGVQLRLATCTSALNQLWTST
jgi:hypothetical protein